MKGLILSGLVALGFWAPILVSMAGVVFVAAIFILPVSKRAESHSPIRL
jgi:hypothetical protein